VNIFASIVVSFVAGLIIWQDFDLRMIPLFVLALGLAEILIQIRWRLSIVCPHCGFDPVLYLSSREKAEEKVKTHLEKRRNSAAFLLSKNANLNLPFRKIKPEAQLITPKKPESVDPARKNQYSSRQSPDQAPIAP